VDQRKRTIMRLGFIMALAVQLIAVAGTLTLRRSPALWMVLRASALLGYIALFWAIVSSEFVREWRKLFGMPFLRSHHSLSVAAWVLILAHPLANVATFGDVSVFVPVFSSVRSFLTLAGRPALYLIALSTTAALLRKRIGAAWKYVHRVNFVAFHLVFAHAWLLGSDLRAPLMRLLWATMAAIVLGIAVRKALPRSR
jgi:sulfoxide reductase heme-binding subunit YedZ